jgi:hypothetical protein
VSFDSQFFRREQENFGMNLPRQCAWVRCRGYRCLAFRDKDNKWRGFYDNTLLPEPVEVLQTI